jgi:hypothetical protein
VIGIHTFSEAGGHPENEDAFVAHPLRDEPPGALVCLADGQGGRAGGGKAARLASGSAGLLFHIFKASWVGMLESVDASVAKHPEAGFTTLIGFSVRGDKLTGASAGDSAVLAVCGSGEVTELTRLQLKNPPVGSGEAVFLPFGAELVRPWKVLAITDGVWKYVGWHRIRDLAARLGGEELLAALQSAARMPGSGQFQDDFTVVLLEGEA